MTSMASRRHVLRLGVAGLAGLASISLLAACGGGASAPAAQATTAPAAAPTAAKPAGAPTAAGAAPTTAAAAAPTSASAATGSVTFLTQTDANGQKIYEAISNDFQQANSGAKVNVVLGGQSALQVQQKLLLMEASNTAPDVYWTHTYITPGLATLDIPQDLTSYISQDKSFDQSDLFPSSIKDFNVGGKQYALPRETTATILVYNKDLFAKAGIAEPTADWKWSDYLAAAQKLTSGEGPNKIWGTGGWPNPPYIYPAEIRVWQEGGDIVSQDRTQYTLDQDPGVRAFQWIKDLIHKYQVHASTTATQGTNVNDLFNTGKVAMLPSINVYSYFKGAQFQWDIQHLPHDGNRTTRVASAGHSMTTKAQNKDLSWKFVAALESKASMQRYFTDAGLPVASRSVREAAVKNQGSNPPAHIQIGIDALDYARPDAVVGNWIGIHQELANALAGVYGPEAKDVKTVLTSVAPKINELIKSKPTAAQ